MKAFFRSVSGRITPTHTAVYHYSTAGRKPGVHHLHEFYFRLGQDDVFQHRIRVTARPGHVAQLVGVRVIDGLC